MIYLASPYHDPDPAVRAERLRLAEEAMHFFFQGTSVFSPIAHNGPSSERLGSHHPADYLLFDFEMLDNADHLAVLDIPNWRQSRGVLMEIGFAIHAGHRLSLVREDPEHGGWTLIDLTPEEMVTLIYKE